MVFDKEFLGYWILSSLIFAFTFSFSLFSVILAHKLITREQNGIRKYWKHLFLVYVSTGHII